MDPWIYGSMDPWIHGSMEPWIYEAGLGIRPVGLGIWPAGPGICPAKRIQLSRKDPRFPTPGGRMTEVNRNSLKQFSWHCTSVTLRVVEV